VPPGRPRIDHATWLTSDRAIPARLVRPLINFARVEVTGGVVMLVTALVALVWANAPFGETYERFWTTPVDVSIGTFVIAESLRGVVNDGLMALFFFVVGMEIKREMSLGELRDARKAALPALAAVGGMAVPALVYLAVAAGGEATRGWGIPMATDIAFSLGVVALLGTLVPIGVKLFLLTLAIVDDLGAIAVIAIAHTGELAPWFLVAGLAGLGLIAVAQRSRIRSMAFYWPVGIAVWFCFLESGVHATIAAVAVGLLTPARSYYSNREYHDRVSRILGRVDASQEIPDRDDAIDHDALAVAAIARESVPPARRLQEAILPWSSFLIIPTFALANAGVRFDGAALGEALTYPVTLGVALGLVVGKTVGITSFAWLAVRLGLGRLPDDTRWGHVFGISIIAGIGFTVSLLITTLAFDAGPLADQAKVGIFGGSLAAGILGYVVLRAVSRRPYRAVRA
jgi:Na+:H+ antiporter, NhaA family